MGVLIGAPSSGSGKTLLSLCLAATARRRGETLQPFKVGPDYLDPQLLAAVAGRPCRNLDPILCGTGWVQRCYRWHGSRAARVLVEGVMGLFDGRGPTSAGSSAEVAHLLDLPAVLVVESSRQAGSLAALVRGFRDHGPPPVRLAGVVLNRVAGERHRSLLAAALEGIGVPLLGMLPNHPALELPSRHLGLLPPREVEDLAERQEIWADLAEEHLRMDRLWPLLAPPAPEAGASDPIRWCLELGEQEPQTRQVPPVPVAIASDAAFHFRYPEATELLETLGLHPVPWSPLADEPLPRGCRAVLLPGGYPELHADTLARAHRSLGQLAAAAAAGMPIVAECGGLLLLGRCLEDREGRLHSLAGVLPFRAAPGTLSLGYREAVATADGLLVRGGERYGGHEFHRWQLAPPGPGTGFERGPVGGRGSRALAARPGLWQLEGWGYPVRSEGWTAPNVHASWLHLHWAGWPVIPRRLSAAAVRFAPPPTNGASFSPAKVAAAPPRNDGI